MNKIFLIEISILKFYFMSIFLDVLKIIIIDTYGICENRVIIKEVAKSTVIFEGMVSSPTSLLTKSGAQRNPARTAFPCLLQPPQQEFCFWKPAGEWHISASYSN